MTEPTCAPEAGAWALENAAPSPGDSASLSSFRVILDDRPLRRSFTGIGNYIAQLLLHLEQVDPGVQVEPFVFGRLSRSDWRARVAQQSGAEAAFDANAAAGENERPAENRTSGRDVAGGRRPWWVRRIIQTGYSLAFRWKTRGFDLYHEPNHVPVRCGLPTVTTIHDLSVVVHPEWHPADRVKWYERDFAAGLRQTRRFIAASEYTRSEMTRVLGIPPERIDVTCQAPRSAFRVGDRAALRAIAERLKLPSRYFLYVGTLEPRKNLPGLLDAFSALPVALRKQCPLLIAGAWGWMADKIRDRLADRGLVDQVRLLGYLRDAELATLYSGCTALVWPTFYEGFGLPPLEAMACGAPVLVSNVTSLPEVVGDAGVLLAPTDTPAWTEQMRRVAEDADWRETLRTSGLAQAARFSWRRCAEQTIACYRKALE